MHRMVVIAFCLCWVLLSCHGPERKNEASGEHKESMMNTTPVAFIVLYDNFPFKEGLEEKGGFSCLVSGKEKTILFDTGQDDSILLSNMKKLGVDPRSIDVVVLSHIHGDHVGGLKHLLRENPELAVYVPKAFPEDFKESARSMGARVVEVEEPLEICDGVHSTGVLFSKAGLLSRPSVAEQAMIVQTQRGPVLITGCAHPGVVEIVKRSKEITGDELALVAGGFHLVPRAQAPLKESQKAMVMKVLSSFKESGVRYTAPSHCTGVLAIELFEQEYGDHFIKLGVGKRISAMDLE